MPLVEYVGNATPQDNTEAVSLAPAQDGSAREIRRGRRALVSGNELRALASHFQVRVVQSTGETDLDEIPTEMPEGYDDEGYEPGESSSALVYGPETHPDVETDATATPASVSAPASPSEGPSPAVSVSPPPPSLRPAPPPSSASPSGSPDQSA